MENLKEIIQEISGYKKSLGLTKLSDDCVLKSATKIFINQENNVGINKTNGEKEVRKFNENNDKLTDKQKFKLQQLNYKGDLNLSKLEAMALIKKLIGDENENSDY